VLEGKVELPVKGRLIDTLGPDDVFGDMALLDNAPGSVDQSPKNLAA